MKLKELSSILGLSPTTVSRALNGYPEVNEATRERVRRVAAENNYRPNRRAMGLATGRAMTIGHVVPLDAEHEVLNPVFAEFISGASQTYNQNGYELLLSIADTTDEEEVYRSVISKGAVDGVIVHVPRRNDERIGLLNKLGIPFVMHGRSSECEEPYSWIDVNNRVAFQQATRLLLDLGHRRIGFINGQEHLDFAWKRRMGYEEVLDEYKLKADPQLMTSSSLTETHGYRAAHQMLQLDSPPTAFITSSYVMGLGVNRAILEKGLKIPADISVVIHDDELSYFNNAGDIPLFTGTRSSVREAGIQAAQMLLDLIDNPDAGPLTKLLEAQLTIGQSTGAVPSR